VRVCFAQTVIQALHNILINESIDCWHFVLNVRDVWGGFKSRDKNNKQTEWWFAYCAQLYCYFHLLRLWMHLIGI